MKKTNNLPFEIRKKGTSNEELASQLAQNTTQLTNLTNDNLVNVKRPGRGLTGVVGDGVADDTANLQAIFTYCANNKLGIYFPVGTICKVTSPITVLSDYRNQTRAMIPRIEGAGVNYRDNAQQYSKIVGYNIPANRGVLELLGTSNGYTVSLEMDGLSIEQDSSCNDNSFCLFLGDAYLTKLQKVRLSGKNGLYLRCGSVTYTNNNWAMIGLTLDTCQIQTSNTTTKEAWAIKPEAWDTGNGFLFDIITLRACEFTGLTALYASNAILESCLFDVVPTLNKSTKTFPNFTNPIEIDFSNPLLIAAGYNVHIKNCHFEDYRRAITIMPWKPDGLIRNVTIEHCRFNGTTNFKDTNGNTIYAEKAIYIKKNEDNFGWVRSVKIEDCVFADNSATAPTTPLFTDTVIANELAEKLIVNDCTTSYDSSQPIRIRNDKVFGYSYNDQSEIIGKVRERITFDVSNLQANTASYGTLTNSFGNQKYILPRKGWIERITIMTDRALTSETTTTLYVYNGVKGWHINCTFDKYDYKNDESGKQIRLFKKKLNRNTSTNEFNAGDLLWFGLNSTSLQAGELGLNAKVIIDIAY